MFLSVKREIYDLHKKKMESTLTNGGITHIWGSGESGLACYNYLKELNREKIVGFIDNDPNKWGEIIVDNIICEKPEKVLHGNHYKVLIGSLYYDDIKQQMLSLGFDTKSIEADVLPLIRLLGKYSKEETYLIYEKYSGKYRQVYTYLNDEESKETYYQIFKSYLELKEMKCLDSQESQYFDSELINLISEEVFLDCGSYDGDTLQDFLKYSNQDYKKYIAIEADAENYSKLIEKIKSNKKIKSYNNSVWNKNEVLYFQSDSTASKITKSGKTKVNAITIDGLDEASEITFIKMDIEGAEYNALIGASKTIKKNSPILAICIYHSLEEYASLPLLIKRLNPNYQIFIRHYGGKHNLETVCYAIPPNRLPEHLKVRSF